MAVRKAFWFHIDTIHSHSRNFLTTTTRMTRINCEPNFIRYDLKLCDKYIDLKFKS